METVKKLSFSFWIWNRDKVHVVKCFFLWSHSASIYYEELKNGLKLVNKLTSEHLFCNEGKTCRTSFQRNSG